MQCNTQALHALSAVVSKVEDKLACLIDQTKGLQDSHASIIATPKDVGRANTSYAETASVHLPVNQVPPIHLKSTGRARDNDSRASNVILFGLPEGKSIIESKSVVDEVFEYLAGRPVVINDIFRLGISGLLFSWLKPSTKLMIKWNIFPEKETFDLKVAEISLT